ncbi:MAG TPA: hypothetical protein VF806_02575 [Anaerolineaceae bacterium]
MRKKQTFLLTVLAPENDEASFCGKIKVIASGKTCTFTSPDELYRLIAFETGEGQPSDVPGPCEKPVEIHSGME